MNQISGTMTLNNKLLIPAFCMAGISLGSCSDKSHQKPNVIIIYADDIGYGDLGCYGATAVKTPNVDRIAAEGIRFTHAYACASTCTPSRYSLLTGEYAFRRNDTGIARGDAPMIIRKEQFTVASLMQDAGYATGVIGKWHLGLGEGNFNCQNWNGLITPGPSDIGFGYAYIMAATGDRTPCVFIENGRIANLDPDDPVEVSYTIPFPGEPTGKNNPELLKMHPSHGHDQAIVNGISRIGYMKGGKSARWVDENIADTIVAKAIQFIHRNQDNPFFLYLGTQDIHVPRVPHPRFSGITGMGPRGDAIAEFDWIVGRVLETLDNLGLTENTMVILSSDNGPVVDDGYQDMAVEKLGNHQPSGDLRGGKYSIFEAGTGIPFLVRWPGHIKPALSESLVSQIDLFATLSQLTGRQIPEKSARDSQRHLDTWTGKSKTSREFVIQQSPSTLSIIEGKWKYIVPGKGPRINNMVNIELGNDTVPQLYDMVNDRAEKVNVAASHPGLVKKLSEKLESVKSGIPKL